MSAITNPLSTVEKRRFASCRAVIKEGRMQFLAVGRAMLTIRNEKLYREIADTFEEFAKDEWGYSKSHTYRLMEFAQVDEVLSPLGDVLQPDQEAQFRVLANLKTAEQRADVWVKAVETAPKDESGKPKVTAAHVKKVAREYQHPASEVSEESEEADTEISEPFRTAAEIEAETPITVGAPPEFGVIGKWKQRLDGIKAEIDAEEGYINLAVMEYAKELFS